MGWHKMIHPFDKKSKNEKQSYLDDVQEKSQKGPPNGKRQNQRLDFVSEEEAWCLFVESVLSLDLECRIQFKGKRGNCANKCGKKQEDQ